MFLYHVYLSNKFMKNISNLSKKKVIHSLIMYFHPKNTRLDASYKDITKYAY